jgi:hypothetical protein
MDVHAWQVRLQRGTEPAPVEAVLDAARENDDAQETTALRTVPCARPQGVT